MENNSIDVTECRRLIDIGDRLRIIDVRTPPEFARVHAAGAVSIPLDELDASAAVPQGKESGEPIYFICQSGQRALKACQRMQKLGIGPVYSIKGGTAAWEAAGLPVIHGNSTVISLERQVRIAAGSLMLLGLLLAITVHKLFLVIPGFIAAGLIFAGVTDRCGMALLLAKMPWNRARSGKCNAT